MRAGIALGSNLGERRANLRAARAQIIALPKIEGPVLASSIYETEPVACAADAEMFLNAVMEIGYAGEAIGLLQSLRDIEAGLGRPARHERNASRTLDLDLLYFGDLVLATPALELPHPRLRARRFVLEPLAEIRPDLILPSERECVGDLLGKLPDGSPLVRMTGEW